MKKVLTLLLFLFCNFIILSAQTTYYVKHDATGANDGSSWTDAYTNLQIAINAAVDNDIIWVTAGTYIPTIDNPGSTDNTLRDRGYYINKSISIYGGFIGGETMLTQRDWVNNETILSGDLGTIGDDTDNALHVVFFDARNTPFNFLIGACLDGFTVEKGNANKSALLSSRGGGMVSYGELGKICAPFIKNCKFIENQATIGGAVVNAGYQGTASPNFSDCIFINNSANGHGGAIYNDGLEGRSNPSIIRCTFINNSALNAGHGGAIFNDGALNGQSNPRIFNCTFLNNSGSSGGAIYNGSTFNSGQVIPQIVHCLFENNTASLNGGALAFLDNPNGEFRAKIINCIFSNNGADHISYDDGAANEQPHFINSTFYGATSSVINIVDFSNGVTPVDFTNCIFWGNNNDIVNGSAADNNRVNIQYSIVEESTFAPANNNLSQDPEFVDAANGDFHLTSSSPAFDAGDNAAISGTTVDIEGNPRIENNVVNIGAYEDISPLLPLSYLSFTGTAQPIGNRLVWRTTNEENTRIHFIWRSVNGKDFEKIGEVIATSESNQLNEYEWLDKTPLAQAYYQIETEDMDGATHKTPLISLTRSNALFFKIVSLYPNPAKEYAFLDFYAPYAATLQLQIRNGLGQLVQQGTVESELGENQLPIELGTLTTGAYGVYLLHGEELISVQKIVVKE